MQRFRTLRRAPSLLVAVTLGALLQGCSDAGSGTDQVEDGTHHDCAQPYPEDARDRTMSADAVRIVTRDNGTVDPSDDQYDVLMPQAILEWIDEHGWLQQHGDWHNVRRWDQGCLRTPPGVPCPSAEDMAARGLSRAPIQETEPGDGYAFLVMHRHMIQGLKEAFPRQTEALRGFAGVPVAKDDMENPVPWLNVRWSQAQLDGFSFLESIEDHLDALESEDELGRWIQFGTGFRSAAEAGYPVVPAGVHGSMHGQWAVPGSPYNLVDNNVNVYPLAFWRLHGWIDEMWERYRRAKGISDDDPDYQAALVEQCEEMHLLDRRNPAQEPPDDGEPPDTGEFATTIAPIFDAYCGGCHGSVSPTKGLVLTGLKPSQIWESIVGQPSSETALALIEPGDSGNSWIVRKLLGDFDGITCEDCLSQMPPAGARPTEDEIQTIRAWVDAGANL